MGRCSLYILCVASLTVFPSVSKGGDDPLSGYWKRPIPSQSRNISLNPKGCGQCHESQYKDWQGSLHSKSVGPGLLGQLRPDKDPEFAVSCYFCHAPMTEQSEITGLDSGEEGEEYVGNPLFDKKLKHSGVSCPVCHLREGKVYGPPTRKVGSQESGAGSKKEDAHNGFIEKDFFEKAEFCAACHQLDEGYELNGKLLTNTYREWKESIYGQSNITCQSCHMPDRRHLFRGIHDQEMAKNGITVEASRSGDKARLVISNSAVGHFFPTYVTPQVVVKGYMLDKNGRAVPSSLKEVFIGRKVSLDLEREEFDTRIAPGKSFEFNYSASSGIGDRIGFEVWVYPDEFYNRLYRAVLRDKNKKLNRMEIERALRVTGSSGYRLFRQVLGGSLDPVN